MISIASKSDNTAFLEQYRLLYQDCNLDIIKISFFLNASTFNLKALKFEYLHSILSFLTS